jgi:2-octaprenylphenol hydroxylase
MSNPVDSSLYDYDVLIIGGGIVGLSLASELVDTDFSVAVIERNEIETIGETTESRVSAINRFALRRYQQSGVLESSLAERMCAFEKMFVWDQTGAGQIEFDCLELGVSELGVIIENTVLQQLLLQRISSAENVSLYCPEAITEIIYAADDSDSNTSAQVVLASGETLSPRLLIGADGVQSAVRKAASIQHNLKSYQQQGLVCNIRTSEPHQNTAWQCFLPTGPLALLPLYDGQSSIVWSLDDTEAQRVMAMEEEVFRAALAEASEFRLGEILEVSKRYQFPLSHGHCEEYVKPGLALIGDAAHNIHPLAGQGANLGIADAAVLADMMKDARQAGRQWSALHTLKKYQRQRKGANRLMEVSMTGFKSLFGNDNAMIAEIRNAGLSLVDHLSPVKYRLIKQALGE